jgi:hypothetical protein
MFTQGTLAHSVWRALVAALSFAIPFTAFAFPGWENITLGAIIFGILHYAQKQLGM